ncbi:MAG: glycoside hydrolase family 15 protein [Deltaproteobacteria bacterium]|nr:glycoside hydrolase family 15 protein [Deltaproteobacteria bacterium]
MASRIEDYGIIGNLRTAALISRSGSVDWMCAPHFDSDACFSSLIGYDEHGCYAIRPTVPTREVRQQYQGDTLVLSTEYECDVGAVRVTDFMPINDARCDLIRRVEGMRGEVPLELVVNPQFGYGANQPWVRGDAHTTTFVTGPDAIRFHSTVDTRPGEKHLRAYFSVRAGEKVDFQLTWHDSYKPAPPLLDVDAELEGTLRYWQEWANRCQYKGRYRDAVLRSLLTLKSLTYAPTGAVIAAPTASLPEEIGGVRNWDYRFCWLRDTTLTLHALIFGGYVDEATAFRDWLLRTVAGAPEEVQIMYSIHGGRRLTEYELPWLPGYEGSKPVRVGNAASEQFQLDIFGETVSALLHARRSGMGEGIGAWTPGLRLVRHLERVWQYPDEGIWEVRGGQKHFTYSKVMAWVAVNAFIGLVEEFHAGGADGRELLPRMRALRERIHEEVCERGFNPHVQAFTQYYGSETLDASVLLIPQVGFLPASDPRVKSTVAAIEKKLLRDGFVLRYETANGVDGLAGSEGAFLACSFWLGDNYALAGRMDEAEAMFDRLLGLRNHLGLLAEEYEPRLQRQIGNFPQGFSHLALINSAMVLDSPDRATLRSPEGEPAVIH